MLKSRSYKPKAVSHLGGSERKVLLDFAGKDMSGSKDNGSSQYKEESTETSTMSLPERKKIPHLLE